MKGLFLVFLIYSLFLFSCSYKKPLELSSYDNKGSKSDSIFISNSRLIELRNRVLNKTEPNWSAWLELKTQCDNHMKNRPNAVRTWSVVGYYDDPVNHKKSVDLLQKDSVAAYRLALCYRITHEVKYAKKSIEFINDWVKKLKSGDTKKVDTKLTMSRLFPMMIVAMGLLNDSYGLNLSVDSKKFIRNVVLPMNSMNDMDNNHADWGLLLVLSASVYLCDFELFKSAKQRFEDLIELQITSSGILRYEVDRSDTKDWNGGPTKGVNGVWYTNYSLWPKVLSAEIFLLNGFNLYDYKNVVGAGIKDAFLLTSQWSVFPETFPHYYSNNGLLNGLDFVSYFEILNPIWSNNNASGVIKTSRPFDYEISFPNITFTHGNLGPDFSLVLKSKICL